MVRSASWPRPRIFDRLREAGRIEDSEMLRTFNCGIGMCAVLGAEEAAAARELLQKRGVPAWEIGAVEGAPGLAEPEVVFR